MARYLSEEWIATCDTVVRSDQALHRATAGVHLTVQHDVTDGPDGDVTFHVTIDDGEVSFRAGPADEATVVFVHDYATAAAIARAELAAQAALLSGKMSVRGDIAQLVAQAGALTDVDGALGSVRETTEFT